MSHELEIVAGKAQMAYAGETPWHGLGKLVPPDLTPAQMLEAAGLDWEVKKCKMSARIGDRTVSSPVYGLYRMPNKDHKDPTYLTSVAKGWNHLQNSEAFDFFNDFVAAGDMEMHTAGSLKDGKLVWALAKVKESFTLFKGDKVESYLLLTNPHWYGKAVDVRFTPVRTVCWNTVSMALSQNVTNKVSIAHRTKFDPELVKEALGIAKFKLDAYKEAAAFLGSKRYTVDSMKEYFHNVFPHDAKAKSPDEPTKQAKRALEIVETQPGHEFAPGTWWNAFNSVTYIVDHEMGQSADNRLTSAWYGSGAKRKQDALNKAMEYAGN